MTKVFVSGCYELIHAGHVEFFHAARAFGDSLTVCFASDATLREWKRREPVISEDARRAILEELRCVDAVVMGSGKPPDYGAIFDFGPELEAGGFDVLVSTEDDINSASKALYCEALGIRYERIPKTTKLEPVSTTQMRWRLAHKNAVLK